MSAPIARAMLAREQEQAAWFDGLLRFAGKIDWSKARLVITPEKIPVARAARLEFPDGFSCVDCGAGVGKPCKSDCIQVLADQERKALPG